jgi:lipoate-protein ligase A
MTLRLVTEKANTPREDMENDYAYLLDAKLGTKPLLHFYEWQPCATYGHFTQAGSFLDLSKIQLYKRPTGGGIIFHVYDVAFGVVVPVGHPRFLMNTMANYRFINSCVIRAIGDFLNRTPEVTLQEDIRCADATDKQFCLAHPTIYDVILGGRKVGGASQRKTKSGFLHQGSVTLHLPDPEFIRSALVPDYQYMASRMAEESISLLPKPPTQQDRQRFQSCLQAVFAKELSF